MMNRAAGPQSSGTVVYRNGGSGHVDLPGAAPVGKLIEEIDR